MATNKQILDLLNTLDSVYGESQKVKPKQIKGYYWALEEFDGDLLDAVGQDAVRLLKWYPKPAELREIANRKQLARENDEAHLVDRRIRDTAYLLHDRYRAGQLTEQEFTSDRAVQYCYRQHGIFTAFFEASDDAVTVQA
jgi:hypothetical protein